MKNTLWLGGTLLLMGLVLALYLLTPERAPVPPEPSDRAAGDRVIAVKDGDTVVIAPAGGGKPYTCRLYGIDTPETPKKRKKGQPYGQDAADELSRLVLNREVHVTLTGDTTYNRQVGTIEVDGVNANLEMVRRGYAWAYVQYLRRPHVSEYRGAEEEARRQRLGLWQEHNPVPPWEFRKRQRLQKLD